MIKVKFNSITPTRIVKCFQSGDKYSYLGVYWNIFNEGTDNYNILDKFIKDVDKIVKPKYIPRWFLNLLHLWGNDNSIIKVRNRRISQYKDKLTKSILITDIKIKYGTIRIYGYFPQSIEDLITEVEELKFIPLPPIILSSTILISSSS
jgi:hypothetical protein